jgi:hypothetical protein
MTGCLSVLVATRQLQRAKYNESLLQYKIMALPAMAGSCFGKPAVYPDVTGEPIMIGDAFFRRLDGSFKFTDQNRRRSHVLMLAEALRRPVEIWEITELEEATGAVRTVRRYLARFTISGSGEPFDGLVVVQFDPIARRWSGTTALAPDIGPNSDYLEGQRQGRRVYVRTP